MRDAPDFNQIARDCIESSRLRGEEMDTDTATAIAEQLRHAWNARGAADIAVVVEAEETAKPLADVLNSLRNLDSREGPRTCPAGDRHGKDRQ